jgi:[ribosomal protein S5]-alanine N-acetyltransferase
VSFYDGLTELPRLPSQRLSLRPLRESDADALFSIFGDAEVMRHWSSPPWTSIDQATALVQGLREDFEARSLFQWGIALADSDTVVGTATLHRLDSANRRAELGYALGRAHWGRGLAREALQCLLAHAFGELRLHRMEADTDPRNARSCALLERLGFAREGLLRERWIVDGEVSDSALYGLLARDWLGRPALIR